MADDKDNWKHEEEEEEEELNDLQYIAQKDAVLFAIDVSQSMLTPPPASDSKKADTDSPTVAALKCAYLIMQQRIISSPKDMMGVLLFGTEKSKFQDDDPSGRGNSSYPHCYLLSDLDVPAASDVKMLKRLVEDEDATREIFVPTKDEVNMSNMLFCANQIFTTKAPNFGSRRLFIITDRDDPHETDKKAKNIAATRAKDLYDLGVTIELFPISRPDHVFDRTKFYDDIIYRDPMNAEETSPGTGLKSGGDGIHLLTSLISDVNAKNVAKRALFSNLPLEIGPSLKISVKGYNILQRQVPARSCYVWVEGEVAQIAVGESAQFVEDTARTVQAVEIKKAYKFGGEQVLFTPEEQKELKNFGPPGLRIIGFKPQSMLPFWASMHKSTFIYPSEDDYVGSTRVFSALWQKLLKDTKMAVAWYVARVNATPNLVAILPSAERIDESTRQQLFPAGLWVYPLPYADDIRSVGDLPQQLVASDALVDQTRLIVQQLQLPKAMYDPQKYPNPSLQWHYRILQAMALEEEIPQEEDDKTVPKFRQIHKRAGEMINRWSQLLQEEYLAVVGERQRHSVKRELDGDDDNVKPVKKARASVQGLEGAGAEALRAMARKGTLGKSTVADLKAWLRGKGLNDSGKKADLLDRIEQWAESN